MSKPRLPLLRRTAVRVLRTGVLCVLVALGALLIFQRRLIYFPQRSSPETVAEFIRGGGRRLDFTTSQGRQTAWFLPARATGAAGTGTATTETRAERLWIVCAGNGSEALDMADLQAMASLPEDAFLLVDYPGYGVSEGAPTPATIGENLAAAVPLAAAAAGLAASELPAKGAVFGHSLGCAAALLGAERFGVRRAVLLSPFISSMEMAKVMLHVPLGWLVTHRFDNRARLASLQRRSGHAWIFHGEDDTLIPPAMGRTLANELGGAATFRAVPRAGHDDIRVVAAVEIAKAMHEARVF